MRKLSQSIGVTQVLDLSSSIQDLVRYVRNRDKWQAIVSMVVAIDLDNLRVGGWISWVYSHISGWKSLVKVRLFSALILGADEFEIE